MPGYLRQRVACISPAREARSRERQRKAEPYLALHLLTVPPNHQFDLFGPQHPGEVAAEVCLGLLIEGAAAEDETVGVPAVQMRERLRGDAFVNGVLQEVRLVDFIELVALR